MTVTIRPFTTADYPAIVGINNLSWPDEPTTVEDLAQEDENRDPKCKFQRWVAELDGRVVGLGFYFQIAGRYHPRKFWMEVSVHPDYQRQGLGSALYEQVIDGLKPHDPLLVRVPMREDMTSCIRFLTKRGLAEEWRSWQMELDLSTCDPARFNPAGLKQELQTRGIEIKSFHELYDDPKRAYKLYELHEETRQDAPFPDQATRLDFEAYMKTIAPHLDQDNNFVAVKDGQYVGFSALRRSDADTDSADISWTGVRRDFRGQRIGLVLKLHSMELARANGYRYLTTTTNSLNRPMIAINEGLGFTRKMAWVYYTKTFAEAL